MIHTQLLHFPALSVVIDVSYNPPEEGYQPPYYRAASAVTLTCRAVGASGQIRYRWSSTCSSCFVSGYNSSYYSYSTHSISKSFLRSRDAGTHTCTAYDSGRGISGSASTVMKVVGKCSQWWKDSDNVARCNLLIKNRLQCTLVQHLKYSSSKWQYMHHACTIVYTLDSGIAMPLSLVSFSGKCVSKGLRKTYCPDRSCAVI